MSEARRPWHRLWWLTPAKTMFHLTCPHRNLRLFLMESGTVALGLAAKVLCLVVAAQIPVPMKVCEDARMPL